MEETAQTLLSERSRLAIMAALAANAAGLDFNALLEATGLTRGNLSVHLKKLEEGKLLAVTKEFIDRKPHSSYCCTAAGRTAVQSYLEEIESLLRKVKKV